MSIYSSLNVGVNGINAQSNKIAVISQNISNTSTVGYKSTEATFKDIISYGPGSPVYSPSGAQGGARLLANQPGNLLTTASSTDLAVQGNGMFVVNDDPSSLANLRYTRAGAFSQDENGNFRNTAGFYLKGWRLDSSGNLAAGLSGTVDASTAASSLETVNVATISATPVATTAVAISANLKASETAEAPGTYDPADETKNMSSGAVPPQFTKPFNIVDANGVTHQFTMGFVKTNINTWSVEVYAQNLSELGGSATTKQIAAGTVTFNGDGTLASVSPSLTGPVPVTWSDGAAASSITFNYGTAGQPFGTPGATVIGRADGLSQFDSAYDLRSLDQNGTSVGKLSNVTVDDEGYLTANYDNATTKRLFKIPLAQFRDPTQLSTQTGDVFSQTVDSSSPYYVATGQSAYGKVIGSSLEQSNVELEHQLTDLVIAQRAYQANTNTVTTTNEMLQSLTQMLGN